jgi:hypothetical protein
VTLKSAQLESIRKKVCTKCAQKRISHHLKCAKVKKSLQKVCKKVCKSSKIVCMYSDKCTHCRLMHTFEKVCTNLPPDVPRQNVRLLLIHFAAHSTRAAVSTALFLLRLQTLIFCMRPDKSIVACHPQLCCELPQFINARVMQLARQGWPSLEHANGPPPGSCPGLGPRCIWHIGAVGKQCSQATTRHRFAQGLTFSAFLGGVCGSAWA